MGVSLRCETHGRCLGFDDRQDLNEGLTTRWAVTTRQLDCTSSRAEVGVEHTNSLLVAPPRSSRSLRVCGLAICMKDVMPFWSSAQTGRWFNPLRMKSLSRTASTSGGMGSEKERTFCLTSRCSTPERQATLRRRPEGWDPSSRRLPSERQVRSNEGDLEMGEPRLKRRRTTAPMKIRCILV